jgi:hypothetical protein
MKDRLDIIAIGIENERSIVARMVGTLSGCAIVAPAGSQCSSVKGINYFTIRRLKREMYAGDGAVGFVDPQFIGVEVAVTFAKNFRQAQRSKDGAIEAFASFDVRDA